MFRICLLLPLARSPGGSSGRNRLIRHAKSLGARRTALGSYCNGARRAWRLYVPRSKANSLEAYSDATMRPPEPRPRQRGACRPARTLSSVSGFLPGDHSSLHPRPHQKGWRRRPGLSASCQSISVPISLGLDTPRGCGTIRPPRRLTFRCWGRQRQGRQRGDLPWAGRYSACYRNCTRPFGNVEIPKGRRVFRGLRARFGASRLRVGLQEGKAACNNPL
jgi:hypothetical protein